MKISYRYDPEVSIVLYLLFGKLYYEDETNMSFILRSSLAKKTYLTEIIQLKHIQNRPTRALRKCYREQRASLRVNHPGRVKHCVSR